VQTNEIFFMSIFGPNKGQSESMVKCIMSTQYCISSKPWDHL